MWQLDARFAFVPAYPIVISTRGNLSNEGSGPGTR